MYHGCGLCSPTSSFAKCALSTGSPCEASLLCMRSDQLRAWSEDDVVFSKHPVLQAVGDVGRQGLPAGPWAEPRKDVTSSSEASIAIRLCAPTLWNLMSGPVLELCGRRNGRCYEAPCGCVSMADKEQVQEWRGVILNMEPLHVGCEVVIGRVVV